jgi:hypothetical protein
MRAADELGFLGEEFLTWLWFSIERDGGEFTVDGHTVSVTIDDFLAFAPRDDADSEQTLRFGLPTRSSEARAALRNGHRLRRCKLVVAEQATEWTLVLDGPTLAVVGARLPADDPEATTPRARASARIASFVQLDRILRGLYRLFLHDRLRPDYQRTRGTEQANWMAQ